MHGVEEAHGESELVRCGSSLERIDRGEAATRRLGEPAMARDSRVVRGNPMGVRRDDRGDLERESLRVGVGPERGATARVLDRERERQPAVRERDRVQPVAQLDGLRCDDGADVGEHLEGVQRCGRLAFRGAQVGLEAVPVAAVGISVGPQRGEDGLRVPAVEEQLEAPPVEETSVAGHEPAGGD
jgi:hypothetical protein